MANLQFSDPEAETVMGSPRHQQQQDKIYQGPKALAALAL